ncbi:MAG: phosphoglucosamine mutase [Planctomycetota bacterium]|jgi:phosphoglucosamine mutase
MTDSFAPFRFGTDGLRGRAGDAPMDTETLRRVGSALGVLLQRRGGDQQRVLVGNDGRESAGWILECLAQGLSAAEVSVTDVGLVTTPALAHLTRVLPFSAGVMVSASHNPAHDNGIKLFSHDGTKLADEEEREIERLALAIRPEEVRTPRIRWEEKLVGTYEEHLVNTFADLDLTGVKICLDAAHGGGSRIAPRVLRAFGAEVVEVACEPDGSNINEGVGATHPESCAAAVMAHGATLGICLDGDGDRSMFVDETGTVRDGDEQLCLFGTRLHRQHSLAKGTVVATVMSNLGLQRALANEGIRMEVTPVGDRNVTLAMREKGFSLGGEQSGHILFAEDGRIVGDALLTALKLLSLPGVLQQGFARAFSSFRRFPQVLVNVKVASKPDLATVPAVAQGAREVEQALGSDGRLVLRYSGTEPLCRVMVEGPEESMVRALAERLAETIRRELA